MQNSHFLINLFFSRQKNIHLRNTSDALPNAIVFEK
jgi:hypothetical protein